MKESNILKQIMLEAGKRGYIAIRLNSGKFWAGVLKNVPGIGMILTQLRAVNGCPEGTADLLILIDGGRVLWVETKTSVGKQREAQKKFQKAVEPLGHKYILARCVEDVFDKKPE